jgi:hypothetical protein
MKTQSSGEDVASPSEQVATGSDNLDFSTWTLQRIGAKADVPPEEPPAEPVSEIPEDTQETAEPETAEEEGIADEDEAPESDDVLSQFGKKLEDLTADELDELGSVVKSRLPQRISKLTRQKKEAEEKAARLEQQLAEFNQKKNPLEKETPVENNPFKDVDSIEGLQDENKRYRDIIEWADDLLDENEHMGFEDVIAEVEGKEMTKREVKAYLKKARKVVDVFLPSRAKELQHSQILKQQAQLLDQQTEAELPWMSGEENDLRVEYQNFIQSDAIKEIKDKVPNAAPAINRLVAHAFNSIYSLKQQQAKPQKATVKATPPSNPSHATALAPERDSERTKKQLTELQRRFEDGGSRDDFVALRTAQLSKRYK